ncbi:MAG: UDP-3-O-(3-hydroxymyristoyl)glucosamine N-acyltransferase [Firmicutes bacterium]|nr:UDP-3-O-(3-hydroxymyristoyl)glucosamine N-acyltransferase [Bacillota bacterium]
MKGMTVKASQVAEFLGKPLLGPDCDIKKPQSAFQPKPNSLVFVKAYSPEQAHLLNTCPDILVLATDAYLGQLTVAHILTDRPRLDFAKAVQRYFAPAKPKGIAATAQIAATANIGADVYIGNFAVIEDDVKIGDGTCVHDYVVIRKHCAIGKRCVVKAHTVIGEEGFGFEIAEDGAPVRIPHLGRVVIGDDVEIGAMNVIARGTLDDTVIEDHVKIDDHVFVAHNVRIGQNAFVIAGAEISGSVRIGRNAWIGPQATVANQVSIGDRALVGIGAVVIKPVEANLVVAGNPARVLRERGPQE